MKKADKFTYGAEIPTDIGARADLLYEVRQARIAMQKETDAVKKRETEIEDSIIDDLSKSDDTGGIGKHHKVRVVTKPVPTIKDWGVLCAWVRKNDRFDLLQRRLSNKAVEDLWEEEDRDVPGVEKFNKVSVSLTKA